MNINSGFEDLEEDYELVSTLIAKLQSCEDPYFVYILSANGSVNTDFLKTSHNFIIPGLDDAIKI